MKNVLCFLFAVMIFTACNNCKELTIMSYNIHHCRGIDGKIDYDRISEVINRVAPDFVALQELDSATRRNNGKVCIEELAQRTEMKSSYASTIKFGGGSYGIGLLSKEKPIKVSSLPLASRGEARRLLIAEFEEIVVCCTHFALNAEDRAASVEIIRNTLKDCKKPLILAGDMNCTSTSPEQISLNKDFTTLNNPEENTYPTVNPDKCIDYIYSAKNDYIYKVKKSEVLYADSIPSDHLPLYVKVNISKD